MKKNNVILIVLGLLLSINIIAQEYYKADENQRTIPIYLDYNYCENCVVTKYDCIPYTDDGSYQEKSELKQNLFSKTIVEVLGIQGNYAKTNINNKEWWIHIGSLIKLSDSEVQEYLKNITNEQNKTNFNSKIAEFKNNNPILFWILFGIGILIFIAIVIFFQRLSTRCKECGKWGAVKIISVNQKLVDVVSTTIRKSEQLTDIYGKKHTNYYHVPATKKIYDHLDKYECKYCGNKTEKDYTTSDTKAD